MFHAMVGNNIPGSCSVVNFYSMGGTYYNSKEYIQNLGGAKFLFATFRNTRQCKKEYEKLKANFPLLFQSEVRTNTHTYNQVFICIFDLKKDKQ